MDRLMTSKLPVIQEICTFDEIPGLFYIPNAIPDAYSRYVVGNLDFRNWYSVMTDNNYRLTQQYGIKYGYRSQSIADPTHIIPMWMNLLTETLKKFAVQTECIVSDYDFNQCVVNSYRHGQTIHSYIDLLAYGPIIGYYTLCNGCRILFSKDDKKVEIEVEPNSLYILSGEARYNWLQEMRPRQADEKNRIITVKLYQIDMK